MRTDEPGAPVLHTEPVGSVVDNVGVVVGRDMKGVRERGGKSGVRYLVEVSLRGVTRFVGSFKTHEEAIRARDEALLERVVRPTTGPVATRKRKANTDVWTNHTLPSGLKYDDLNTADIHFRGRGGARVVLAYHYAGGRQFYLGRYDSVRDGLAAQARAKERYEQDGAAALARFKDPGPLPPSEWRIRPKWSHKKKEPEVRYVVYGNSSRYVGTYPSIERARHARDLAWNPGTTHS